MGGAHKTDPYLERLRSIQAENAGIDARLNALEVGYALEAKQVDEFVQKLIADKPARYEDFLSRDELVAIDARYRKAINKGVECDALDYALAAVCGFISGLIDVLFTSTPGQGAVAEMVDGSFDKVVIRLAKTVKDKNGEQAWRPKKGETLKSAIGFLESRYHVGYDQAKSADIQNAVKHLSADNHHAKSLGHYPDLIGLVASICNQFTDTSTFFDSKQGTFVYVAGTGKGIELRGDTFTAKVFSGTVNWFFHCISDVAGSSGSKTRGQGLPIPLTDFFQLCDFGRFPNEKDQWQSLASVMTQVYEQGYDLRHGVAASFPVILNDLLVRAIYTLKRHFADNIAWAESLPKADSPEMQRMVTVGTGTLCLVDLGHATATSWGNWVVFFGKLNVAAWARLGLQGVKEIEMIAAREDRNIVSINDELTSEWNSLLERSRALLE